MIMIELKRIKYMYGNIKFGYMLIEKEIIGLKSSEYMRG